MTLKQLRKTARRWAPWWRDRLGLRDWLIDLEYVPNLEPLAKITPDYARRCACIRISSELTRWLHEDVEHTIVHELLHVHLGACGVGLNTTSHDPGTLDAAVIAEQVINALADILVDLRKGKQK